MHARPPVCAAAFCSTILALTCVAITTGSIGRSAVLSAQAAPLNSDRWRYLMTARQGGIVGYRDPVGAIAPDGRWLAYGEGRIVRLTPTEGGPVVSLPAGEGQIRHIVWRDAGHLVADDQQAATRWWSFDVAHGTREPLWPDHAAVTANVSGGGRVSAKVNELRQFAWSADGRRAAAVSGRPDGSTLWRLPADGGTGEALSTSHRLSYPAWSRGGDLACISSDNGRPRLMLPCGVTPWPTTPDLDVYGPLAFSADGATLYFAASNDRGTVDLWSADVATREARRRTSFARDSYHPSVASDGTVVFKVQTYRTFVADVPFDGGPTRPLTTFQSETPSYDPTGTSLGVTYGTWRRVIDDLNYPDIAQEVGLVPADSDVPAAEPQTVVAASYSEDQAMCWSPNRRWLVVHSHKDMSDDLWLMKADFSGKDRRVTFLGRGAETGWPRWSPDGRTVVFDAASRADGRGAIYVMGVDQDTGDVTQEAREVRVDGFEGEASHAEWLPDSQTLLVHGILSPGEHVLFTVPRTGGPAKVFHRYRSEHTAPGAGVSPDGTWAAYAAPAADGRLQIFRVPVAGGTPVQLTFDPTDKTQPTFSPDGRRLALTVWTYEAQFWMLGGGR
ncbi:MAG: hypothetical protein U0Q12_17365 [Vicinamibacterales bacterium]